MQSHWETNRAMRTTAGDTESGGGRHRFKQSTEIHGAPHAGRIRSTWAPLEGRQNAVVSTRATPSLSGRRQRLAGSDLQAAAASQTVSPPPKASI